MSKKSSTDLLDLYEGKDYLGRYHDSAGDRIARIVNRISFSKNDKVLDIGCGNGLLLPVIIGDIKHYDGIDFSKSFIAEAKKRAEKGGVDKNKFSFYNGDVVNFCRKHRGYNKVFALDFTEHINDREFKAIFSAVRPAIKIGGKLVMHTPNSDYIVERIKSERTKIDKQGHIGLRNAEEYRTLLSGLGYKKIEVIPLNHYVTVLKPLHVLSYIPINKLSSLFQARLLITCEA